MPIGKLSIVTGTWDALVVLGKQWGRAGDTAVFLLGIGFLYACVANVVTWSLGANRVAAVAAEEGMLPEALGRLHPRFKTPYLAFVWMGIVSTGLLVGGALLSNSQSNIFWMTFRVTALCLLLCYLLVFPAFLVLRNRRPDQPRPYRLPGGRAAAAVAAWVCTLYIFGACVLFFVPSPTSQEPVKEAIILGAADAGHPRGRVTCSSRDGPASTVLYDSAAARVAADALRRQETQSMAQNLTGAREESAYVLDLIGKKTLSPPEQDKVIEDSVRYWTDYVNPGFLEYRKSVSTDYTAVEWEDHGAVFRDVQGKEFIDMLGGFGIYVTGPPASEGPQGGPGAARAAGDPFPGADRPAAHVPRAAGRDDHARANCSTRSSPTRARNRSRPASRCRC